MKKISIFTLILCVALLLSITTAFAWSTEAVVGDEIPLTDFYDKDGNSLNATLNYEDYRISPTIQNGKQYVDSVYFYEGDAYLRLKSNIQIPEGTSKHLSGTISIYTKTSPSVRYVSTIDDIRIIPRSYSTVVQNGPNNSFTIPSDYYMSDVKFDFNGKYRGKLHAVFDYCVSGDTSPVFDIDVKVPLENMFLRESCNVNKQIEYLYGDKDTELTFYEWDGRPDFKTEGTLSLFVKPNDTVYEILPDNSLREIKGEYDSVNDRFSFKTSKLTSYVVSNKKLKSIPPVEQAVSSTASSKVPASSSKPTPSSSKAPAPSPSSKPEEKPSNSSEEASSSVSSSESEEVISPSSSEVTSEPSSQSTETNVPTQKEEKSSVNIALIVAIAVAVIAVVALIYVIVFTRSKRHYDDWEE